MVDDKNKMNNKDYNLEGVKELLTEKKIILPRTNKILSYISDKITNTYKKVINFIGESNFLYIKSSISYIQKIVNHHVTAHLRGIVRTSMLIAAASFVVSFPTTLVIYASLQLIALTADTIVAYKRHKDIEKLEENLKYSQYFKDASIIEKKFVEQNYKFATQYGVNKKTNEERRNNKLSKVELNKTTTVKRFFADMAGNFFLRISHISQMLSISGAIFMIGSYLQLGVSKNDASLRSYYINKIRDAQEDFPDYLKGTKDTGIIKDLALEKMILVKTMMLFKEKTENIDNKNFSENEKNFILKQCLKQATSEVKKHPDFSNIFQEKNVFQRFSSVIKDFVRANNPFRETKSMEELIESSKNITTPVISLEPSVKKTAPKTKNVISAPKESKKLIEISVKKITKKGKDTLRHISENVKSEDTPINKKASHLSRHHVHDAISKN
jgi:hypothetical protein